MKKVAIIGGTGNGLVVAQIILDLIASGKDYQISGFLNDHLELGTPVGRWKVIGKPDDWHLLPKDTLFIPAILSVGKMRERATRLKSLNIPRARWATLVHPTCNVGFDCEIGVGVAVCAHTTLQPGSTIGDYCIIRAGANLGHDVTLGDYVDIGPNTTLCGYAKIDEGVQVAPNAVVRDNVTVGQYATVAAGAAIFKHVPEFATMLGNPARRIR